MRVPALRFLSPLLPELLQLPDARQYRTPRVDLSIIRRRVSFEKTRLGYRVRRGGIRPLLGVVARLALLWPLPLPP